MKTDTFNVKDLGAIVVEDLAWKTNHRANKKDPYVETIITFMVKYLHSAVRKHGEAHLGILWRRSDR